VVRIGGKTLGAEDPAIIVPNQPSAMESYAARDLRHHLELVTGQAAPEFRSEKDAGSSTPISWASAKGSECQRVGLCRPGLGGHLA